ncbi:hypothetical protein QGN29_08065 [Temperatibacter marinus]|uniref:Uncharacterized protein n=1 Tax=Temperatibacter marinus TaxID=1456591 RepID=A0AA52EFS6_9PROT|nr:hypothetical protein [Temperatibacter marinus]WND01514.1 hypothetical protein QGN29_08065 [Temperatibacter marinus]
MRVVILYLVGFFIVGLGPAVEGRAAEQKPDDPQETIHVAVGLATVYAHVFEEILRQSNVPFVMQRYDYKQIRKNFIEGKVGMTCCSHPIWRNRPEEVKIQHFTKPIFYAINSYAYHKDIDPSVATFSNANLTFAAIIGWTYTDDIKTKKWKYFKSTKEATEYVHDNENAFTVVNRQDFLRLGLDREFDVTIRGVYERKAIHIRVRDTYKHYIPRMNEVIKKMRKTLQIERIIASEIRKQPE